MAVGGKYSVELAGYGLMVERRKYGKSFGKAFLPPQSVQGTAGEVQTSEFW